MQKAYKYMYRDHEVTIPSTRYNFIAMDSDNIIRVYIGRPVWNDATSDWEETEATLNSSGYLPPVSISMLHDVHFSARSSLEVL